MDNGKSLYNQLSSDKLYTKSYDDFVKQYGNPEGQKELYNKLSSDNLYTKSEEDFVNQYWAPVKKRTYGIEIHFASCSIYFGVKRLGQETYFGVCFKRR